MHEYPAGSGLDFRLAPTWRLDHLGARAVKLGAHRVERNDVRLRIHEVLELHGELVLRVILVKLVLLQVLGIADEEVTVAPGRVDLHRLDHALKFFFSAASL